MHLSDQKLRAEARDFAFDASALLADGWLSHGELGREQRGNGIENIENPWKTYSHTQVDRKRSSPPKSIGRKDEEIRKTYLVCELGNIKIQNSDTKNITKHADFHFGL